MKLYRRQAPPGTRWGGLVLLATLADSPVPEAIAAGTKGAVPQSSARQGSAPQGSAPEQPSWSVADMIALATTQVDRQPAMLRAARARASSIRDHAAVSLAGSLAGSLSGSLSGSLAGSTSGHSGAKNAVPFEVRY